MTYDLTLAAARAMASPRLTFCYVSGAGTDSTERGRMMWARVKGATENALLRMPFKAAYMLRPGAHPAAQGRAVEDPGVPVGLRGPRPGPAPAAAHRARPDHDDGGGRPRHDRAGPARIAKPILDPEDINKAAISAG